jgi:hypothetical protein
MSAYDPSSCCLSLKFVYYGASGVGKTTSLRLLEQQLGGELLCLDTHSTQTLFFDLLTIVTDLTDRRLLLRLYSVPGDPIHLHTRKLLLRGADGVVLVGDPASGADPSTADMQAELRHHLRESGIRAEQLPLVCQPRPFGAAPESTVIDALLQLLQSAWGAAEQLAQRAGASPIEPQVALSELRRRLKLPRLPSIASGRGPRPAAAALPGNLQSQPRQLSEQKPAKSARGIS